MWEGLAEELSYFYTTMGQNQVDVCIIDTGINADLLDFEGRVTQSLDYTGEGLGDLNGHGKLHCWYGQ